MPKTKSSGGFAFRYDDVIARPRELWSLKRALSGAPWALDYAAAAVQALWHVIFQLIMMLIALVFLLRDGHRMLQSFRRRTLVYADLVDTLGAGRPIGREVGHRR